MCREWVEGVSVFRALRVCSPPLAATCLDAAGGHGASALDGEDVLYRHEHRLEGGREATV